MMNFNSIFYSFSVDNLNNAQQFYSEIIGLKTERNDMGLRLLLPGGATAFIYQKQDHQPASFTILNFEVSDIDEAVKYLNNKGVELEYYEGLTDENRMHRGIALNTGPDIAWFRDPAGNILSVLQEA